VRQHQGKEDDHDDEEDTHSRGLPGVSFEEDVHVDDEWVVETGGVLKLAGC
jgi:hypothetical protein